MNEVFERFEGVVDGRSVSNYLEVLGEADEEEVRGYLVREYMGRVGETNNVHVLRVGAWVLGEMVREGVGEAGRLLMEVGRRQRGKEGVMEWIVPAIIKLAQTEGFENHSEVKEFLL